MIHATVEPRDVRKGWGRHAPFGEGGCLTARNIPRRPDDRGTLLRASSTSCSRRSFCTPVMKVDTRRDMPTFDAPECPLPLPVFCGRASESISRGVPRFGGCSTIDGATPRIPTSRGCPEQSRRSSAVPRRSAKSSWVAASATIERQAVHFILGATGTGSGLFHPARSLSRAGPPASDDDGRTVGPGGRCHGSCDAAGDTGYSAVRSLGRRTRYGVCPTLGDHRPSRRRRVGRHGRTEGEGRFHFGSG